MNFFLNLSVGRIQASQIVICIAFLALLGGCATEGGQIERWDLMKSGSPHSVQAKANEKTKVAMVFVRKVRVPARAGEPINIYVNGQYQASLVGDVFTELGLCPGLHRLQVAFTDYRNRYASKQEGTSFKLEAQPFQYFLVDESDAGDAVLTPIDPQHAVTLLPSVQRLQTHAISRVVNDGCLIVKN